MKMDLKTNLKHIAILALIVNLLNGTYKLFDLMTRDFDWYFVSILASIFIEVAMCMGVYAVGCLMDEISELEEYMINFQKQHANRQYGSNVNIPNYNYQNQAYVNQNMQNTGYVESQPIFGGWTCSCGCNNASDVYYCMQCGKERE